MVVIPIRVLPDPVLRQKARRVRTIDKSVQRLIDDLLETMQSAAGVGLSAPQVGVPLRVIVIRLPEEEEEIVLVNPAIIRKTGDRTVKEGCLSIPGYVGQIQRAESVRVKGRDRSGKEVRLRAEDLLAQTLEHEIDHINGVLYVDHLASLDELRPAEPAETETEAEPLTQG